MNATYNDIQFRASDFNYKVTSESLEKTDIMDGDKLKRVALIPAFWFAWVSFFPETNLIK